MCSMVKTRRAAFLAITIILVFSLSTCRNPLLAAIDEAVTIAVTPPEIISVFPAVDASNVAINSRIVSVEFSKAIKADTVKSPNITIHYSTQESELVYLTGSWLVNNNTVTFTANTDLSYSTVYTITIGTGLLDMDGKSLISGTDWSFTTGIAPDTVKPQIQSVLINEGSPWANTLTVSIGIDASDNYDSAQGTSIAQMNINGSGWVPFNPAPSFTLPAGEGLRTINVVVKDGSGNESSPASGNINIDTIAPTIGHFFVNNGKRATNTPSVSMNIQGQDTGSGPTHFRFSLAEDDWGAWTELVEGFGSEPSIALTIDLDETQSFQAEVRDLAGNVSAIGTTQIIYETTPPLVMSKQPDGVDATNYPANAGLIRIRFNEELDTASVTPATFYMLSGTTPADDTSIVISSDKKELQLVGFELDKGRDYIVMVRGGSTNGVPNGITDEAGNAFASDYTWNFRTGSALDTTPPDGTIILDVTNEFHFSPYVTSDPSLKLIISATDDYNLVDGMKIWGKSDGSNDPATGLPYPRFEEQATWLDFDDDNADGKVDKDWKLPATEGFYSLHYKFMDIPQNTMEVNRSVEIALDLSDPVISGVTVTNHTGVVPAGTAGLVSDTKATNDPDREITFVVDATDAISGIARMWISVDGTLDTEPAQAWSPMQTVTLPAVDGVYTLVVGVRDFVERPEAAPAQVQEAIILDRTPPQISFAPDDIQQVNVASQQTGTFADTYGIASWLWEQYSGPGTLAIDIDEDEPDKPIVSANQDGEYQLKVTVTDKAGNIAFGVVPFIWDTTPPGGTVSLAANQYSANNRPTWTWSSTAAGHDFYRLSMNQNFTAYVDVSLDASSYTPVVSLSDGSHTLYVKAMDNAGNSGAVASTTIIVDTIAPVITNAGQSYTTNASVGISAVVTEGGSGIASHAWSKASGPGTISFSAPTSATTNATADIDGQYVLRSTVIDNAGNTTTGDYYLIRDTVPPVAPVVNAPDRTPDLFPSWSWNTGGGGNGMYSYKLEREEPFDSGIYTLLKDWTAISATSYTLEGSYSNDHTRIRLSVREQDGAGNHSAWTAKVVWLDSSFTSPPNVIRGGTYLRNSATTSVTWTWTSGLPPAAGNSYRFRLDNADLSAQPETNETSYTKVFSTSGSEDGVHTIYVEQRNLTNSQWTGKVGNSTVQIDATPPGTPTIGTKPSNPTNVTSATWTWTSGGNGGTGYYRYRINSGAWSYSYSTGVTLSITTAGTYTFEVQESDTAGNWSASGSHSYVLDRTAPNAPVVSAGPANPTNLTTVTWTWGTGGNGGNGVYRSRINGSAWSAETTTASRSNTSATEGTYTLEVQERDAAGNWSGSGSWVHLLDTTPPAVSSFNINSNAAITTAQTVTLYSTVTGAVQMRMKNGTSTFSTWDAYTATRSWNLSSGAGTKLVTVEYRDLAGNITTTTIRDWIFFGAPALTHATKGFHATGAIDVYGSTYGNDDAAVSTNIYYLYYAPSAGGTKTLHSTSSSPTFNLTGMTEGVLYYFFVRISNSQIGFSDYSPYQVGFSSDVTIIYNASTESTLATTMKVLLEGNHGIAYPGASFVTGTWPVYTVTLLPETEVSSLWYTTSDRSIIYGDPVITTPGTSLWSNSTKVRNVIHRSANTLNDAGTPLTGNYSGGLIAMGESGARLLDTTRSLMSGYTDDAPANIGYYYSMNLTTGSAFAYQWTTAEPIPNFFNKFTGLWTYVYRTPWSYPLTSTSFAGGTSPTHNASTQLSYASLTRNSVYLSGGANPPNGWIYTRDYDSSSHFPVVRQGRFLQYGFSSLTDRPYTGMIFFVNLVARMKQF